MNEVARVGKEFLNNKSVMDKLSTGDYALAGFWNDNDEYEYALAKLDREKHIYREHNIKWYSKTEGVDDIDLGSRVSYDEYVRSAATRDVYFMFICEHEDLMCYDANSNEFLLVEVIDKEHYVGEIGDFYYDSELFHIAMVDMADLPFSNMSFPASQERIDIREVLLYDGPLDQPVREIPKGLLSCDLMFAGKVFKKGFKLEIDTSDVVSMAGMFGNSELPEGFTLGDRFDTSSVEDMFGMFYGDTGERHLVFPEGFSLGSKFSTMSARVMNQMFEGRVFPKDFSFGSGFMFNSVEDASGMFEGADFRKGFPVSQAFSGLRVPLNMFNNCILPDDAISFMEKYGEEVDKPSSEYTWGDCIINSDIVVVECMGKYYSCKMQTMLEYASGNLRGYSNEISNGILCKDY